MGEPSVTITITEPADNSVINLNDKKRLTIVPPPALWRTIHVAGTVTGSDTVYLNTTDPFYPYLGPISPAPDGTWSMEVPAREAGILTLTARAGTKFSDPVNIAFFQVVIDLPKPGTLSYLITGDPPTMPAIQCKAHVDFGSGRATLSGLLLRYLAGPTISKTKFTFQLNLSGCYRGAESTAGGGKWYHYDEPFPVPPVTGSATVAVPWKGMIIGGLASLTVTADMPGLKGGTIEAVSDPVTFDVHAQDGYPTCAQVTAYVTKSTVLSSATAFDFTDKELGVTFDHVGVFLRLINHESAGQQFGLGIGTSDPCIVPEPWGVKCDDTHPGYSLPGRPHTCANNVGIGLTQQEDWPHVGPTKWPAVYWNWQTNIDEGIDELVNTKLKDAKRAQRDMQGWIDQSRHQAIGSVNANRDAAKDPRGHIKADDTIYTSPINVPAMRDDQLAREALRRYNSGWEYRWNQIYYVDRGAVDYEIRSTGWKTGPGIYGIEPGAEPGTAEWKSEPSHTSEPGYVDVLLRKSPSW